MIFVSFFNSFYSLKFERTEETTALNSRSDASSSLLIITSYRIAMYRIISYIEWPSVIGLERLHTVCKVFKPSCGTVQVIINAKIELFELSHLDFPQNAIFIWVSRFEIWPNSVRTVIHTQLPQHYGKLKLIEFHSVFLHGLLIKNDRYDWGK